MFLNYLYLRLATPECLRFIIMVLMGFFTVRLTSIVSSRYHAFEEFQRLWPNILHMSAQYQVIETQIHEVGLHVNELCTETKAAYNQTKAAYTEMNMQRLIIEGQFAILETAMDMIEKLMTEIERLSTFLDGNTESTKTMSQAVKALKDEFDIKKMERDELDAKMVTLKMELNAVKEERDLLLTLNRLAPGASRI